MYERSSAAKHIREKLPAVVQPFLSSFESGPSPGGSSPLVNSQGASLPTSDVTSSDIGGSAAASADTNLTRVPPEPDAANPPAAQEGPNLETQVVPFQEPSKPYPHQSTTAPSFLPSLRFPSIPRQLDTPLSSFGSEYFQVSDTTSSELDLSLCVFGCTTKTSRELILFDQPPSGATTIEILWDPSHGSQARRCDARRYFKYHHSSVLDPRHGRARDKFLSQCRTFTHNGSTARKI